MYLLAIKKPDMRFFINLANNTWQEPHRIARRNIDNNTNVKTVFSDCKKAERVVGDLNNSKN